MKVKPDDVVCNFCGRHYKFVEFLLELATPISEKGELHICNVCSDSITAESEEARKQMKKRNK